ncbi:hypothetical protein BT96DRAFT_933098 [Gymnopus androsaceus JB14]|uniref:Uncharacterized protein n=1 Tax=Gymnopus androsaceus JB14 TaxID=1447944 RepID=A0A6A4I6P1_9AGAR|nr:hypothetical protein BT96DRAFT_933098 [Gymnopus androsaceus JB14]
MACATRPCPLSHPLRLRFEPQFLVWNHMEKAELGCKVASQANELVKVRSILAESLNVIATCFAELERQTAVLEAAHRINNAQLEHLQGINDSNAFEVEHLLSKLSIADEAILRLFKEQIAKLKAEKESIIDDLVQTFQVNVSLHSSLNKAYRDVGDLAMSALLAHHADLECPLRVIIHNITVAHCGFKMLYQFANEADTLELEALLESISHPLESNLLFFHEILRAHGMLEQLYPFNSDLISYVGFHGAWAHDLFTVVLSLLPQ